jgi:type IV pilus assembly protein PilC
MIKSISKKHFLRLSIKTQILFAKRLGVLINSGVPIMEAMQILEKQSTSKPALYIFGKLTRDVESGQMLSAAMAKFKKVFGEFAVNIVSVGEASGSLSANLSYLADELNKKQELRRKIVAALVYPVFIAASTVGITILLTAYVFPKILPIFQSFKANLPWSTRVLIFLSSVLLHYWFCLLAACLIIVIGVSLFLKNQSVRLRFDKHIIFIPFIGSIVQAYTLANFARTFGLLLKSDVPITEALKIVSATSGNLAYRKEFLAMRETLFRGEKISAHMEKQPRLFPAMLSQMIAVGETTGNLSGSLMFLAAMYEDDLNNFTKNLSTTIEPVLMIFMGLLVGFVAISIITPIYSITQNLHP